MDIQTILPGERAYKYYINTQTLFLHFSWKLLIYVTQCQIYSHANASHTLLESFLPP